MAALIAVLVVVETLVWGHLGIVSGIRRGAASARAQVQRRREEQAAAQAAAIASGTTPTPAAQESWPRRVATETRAFVQGMEMDRRAAAFGTFVEAHYRNARWAGIALGALILLLWPSPTLSVLIWIAAVVALYIGALEWLRSKAPEASAVPTAAVVPAPRPAVPGVNPDGVVGAVPQGAAGSDALPPPVARSRSFRRH